MHGGPLHKILSCRTVPGKVLAWSGTQASALMQWHKSRPTSCSRAIHLHCKRSAGLMEPVSHALNIASCNVLLIRLPTQPTCTAGLPVDASLRQHDPCMLSSLNTSSS